MSHGKVAIIFMLQAYETNWILLLNQFSISKSNLPVEGGIKALAEVPVGDGGEYFAQRFIIKGIDRDDVQVTSEAA